MSKHLRERGTEKFAVLEVYSSLFITWCMHKNFIDFLGLVQWRKDKDPSLHYVPFGMTVTFNYIGGGSESPSFRTKGGIFSLIITFFNF